MDAYLVLVQDLYTLLGAINEEHECECGCHEEECELISKAQRFLGKILI